MYKPILLEAQNFFLLIPDSNKGFYRRRGHRSAIQEPRDRRAPGPAPANRRRRPSSLFSRKTSNAEERFFRYHNAIIKCVRFGTVGCERRRAKSSVGLTSAVLKPSADSVAAFSRVLSLEAIWIDADFCGHSRGSPS